MPTVYRELCLLLGEEGRESLQLILVLFDIEEEEECIGVAQNIYIHKYLKYL